MAVGLWALWHGKTFAWGTTALLITNSSASCISLEQIYAGNVSGGKGRRAEWREWVCVFEGWWWMLVGGGGNLQILAVHDGSRYEMRDRGICRWRPPTGPVAVFQLRFSALRVLQMASADALRVICMPPQISRFLLLVAFLLKPALPLYWRFSGWNDVSK